MPSDKLSRQSATLLSELLSKQESKTPINNVVDPGSDIGRLLLLIAIPHWFSETITTRVVSLYEKHTNKKIEVPFTELLFLSFVSEYRPGHFVLHERIRNSLIRYWRDNEANLLVLLSKDLINYFEQYLNVQNNNISRLFIEGEIVYHMLLSSPEKGLSRLRNIFEQNEMLNNFSNCEFLVKRAYEQKPMLSVETESQIDYYSIWLKILQGYPSSALELLREIKNRNLPQQILLQHQALEAEALRHLGRFSDALEILNILLKTYHEQSNRSSEAFILSLIAMVQNSLGQKSESIIKYHEALELYNDIKSQEGVYWVHHNLGALYSFSRSNWKDAVVHLKIALEYWKNIGHDYYQANTLQNLGRAFELGGEWKEALNYYQRSLDLRTNTDDEVGTAASLLHLGRIYVKIGQWDNAIITLYKCINIYDRLNMFSPLGDSYRVLADAYREIGDWENSENMYERALFKYKKAKNKLGMAVVLTHWGQMKVYSEDYSSAANLFHRASTTWKKLEK